MAAVVVDSPRGGISLETERTAAGMSSKLLLTRATVQDGGTINTSRGLSCVYGQLFFLASRFSGNYTCAPPGAQPANVTVHVLNGEYRVNYS